jgi:hypothetical protein
MGAKVPKKPRRRAGSRRAPHPRRRSDRVRGRRLTIVCINRYGLAFTKNKTPATYHTSGRNISSYYRVACTRCGFSFAQGRWKAHNLANCDLTIRAFRNATEVAFKFQQVNLYGRVI